MYKYIFLLISILASFNIIAQCPPGNVYFYSQNSVDQFIIDYPDCTVVSGDLKIFDSITDLLAFHNIKTVEGDLHILGNNDLTNLTGLDSISIIGGDLSISSCGSLTSLNGLDNLINIGASLRINNNPSLSNISALSNLVLIEENLSIKENDNLINLFSLNQITSISGYIIISDNESLNSLSGLENIDSIGNYLSISSNNTLTNLNGLDNLVHVQNQFGVGDNMNLTSLDGVENLTSAGNIGIAYNPVLKNVESLSNLASIETIFYIGYNDDLQSLKGLGNIDPTSITCVKIYGNSSLTTCEVNSICNALTNLPSMSISIATNAPGCNNQNEIEDACTISSIDNPKKQEISIYPNPTYDLLQTSAKIGTSYSILDRFGIRRQQNTIPASQQIDLSGITTGVYYIQFETGSIEKVVKW